MMDDRLTRCPHCSTCFAVSDADLQQAFGVARCGRCKKIFNAANHLFELEADENTSPVEPLSPGLSDRPEALAEEQTSRVTKQEPSATPAAHLASNIQAPNTPAAGTQTPETTQTSKKSASASVAKASADPVAVTNSLENAEAFLESLPDAPDLMLDDNDLSAIREARQAPELRNHQLEVSLKADRHDEAPDFNPDLHFSAEPDHEHHEQKPKENQSAQIASGLPWVPATLAASLIILILVLLWGNTRTLSQSPGLSGFAEAICSMTGCDHYLPSDFDELKASQLAIFEINKQLTAELVLNNPTTNPLPFPAILLELRDRSGKIISEILYQPDTYLKGKPFADHMLPSDLPVALSFPIQARVSDIENLSVRYYPAADQ